MTGIGALVDTILKRRGIIYMTPVERFQSLGSMGVKYIVPKRRDDQVFARHLSPGGYRDRNVVRPNS